MKKQNLGKKIQLRRRENHKCLGLVKMEVFHEDAVSEHTVGNMEHICGKCALMFQDEQHKNIKKNQKMSYLLCCSYGSVQVPPVSEPPALLRTLLSGNSSTSCHFIQNIRAYNSAFAFALMTFSGHEFAFQGKGSYCFRINGQVYHTISQLLPEPGVAPKFSQLYLHDAATELNAWLNIFSNLHKEIVTHMK